MISNLVLMSTCSRSPAGIWAYMLLNNEPGPGFSVLMKKTTGLSGSAGTGKPSWPTAPVPNIFQRNVLISSLDDVSSL
jgi:hypothetical protein